MPSVLANVGCPRSGPSCTTGFTGCYKTGGYLPQKKKGKQNPMLVLLSGTQRSSQKARQAKASLHNQLRAQALAEEAAAAGCKGSSGAGGRAEPLLASPRTHTEVASGTTLPPVWVFAVLTAQAAEPLFTGRLGRFTAEVGVCFMSQ